MNNICILKPIIKNKPSKLYTDLMQLTNNDRKLTNFLYALSLQDEIKTLFSNSDFNSQGQIKTDLFIKKLNLDQIISDKARIKYELTKIKGIDGRGKRIHYKDVNTILQDVYEFNDSHDALKAQIKFEKDGYYIDIDTINDENFNTNNKLKIREQIYNNILQQLQNQGLNTNLSEDSRQQFNIINIFYNINKLKDLPQNMQKLSPQTISLLFDLFESNPFVSRLKRQFRNEVYNIVAQHTGYFVEDSFTPLSDQQKDLINRALNDIKRQLARANNKIDYSEIIEQAKINTQTQNTLLGANAVSVKDTLNDLYKTYHLDQDMLNSLQKRVDKISDAANQLFQIRLNRYETERIKGVTDRHTKGFLKKIQRDIEAQEYLLSISKMLNELVEEITDVSKKLNRMDKNLERHPDSLQAINGYSSFILEQLNLINSFEDILEQLQNIELLEQDDNNTQLIGEIKQVSSNLKSILSTNKINVRKKQVEVVKAFLRLYWGEDSLEMQKLRGDTTTLDDIMEMANQDINFFDRFIWATNTTNNEMMNLIAQAVKDAHEKRDSKLRKQLQDIRSITQKLYQSGSNTNFMFEMDKNGYPKRILSDYDYDKYEQEEEKYIEEIKNNPDIKKSQYDELISKWKDQHTQSISFNYTNDEGVTKSLRLSVPIYEKAVKVKDLLNDTQYEYWQFMMNKKAQMLAQIDSANNNDLFNVIEVSNDITTAISEAGGNPNKVWGVLKNKITDMFQIKEDDTDYGSILDANGLVTTHLNSKGESIDTLPIFYTREIKDRSRVSTDFSRSMMVYLSASQQYIEMNKILDSLLLTKDYMLQKLNVPIKEGGNLAVQQTKLGKKIYVNVATKLGVATGLEGLADDFYERVVFSKSRKQGKTISLFGTKISLDKATDSLVGYSSVTGLMVNTLGAQANLFVGKLQMLIDSGIGMGGEFFNMKDLGYAETKYWQLLAPVLNEIKSNNKSSLLGLLMDRFDVTDDFYEKMKESGFYKNPISKVLGNTSLFFLYGIGEHLLHAQGMLAVLHNIKAKDSDGNIVNLFDVFKVEKDDTGNGILKIKEGYTFYIDDKNLTSSFKHRINGKPINEKTINVVKGAIAYVNKSMHGAFGYEDKGMLHRYAVGRLIMNFRQWMPAHYARRFRGKHYDTDLGEYREGYYVSAFKFLRDCVQDLKDHKLQIATRWNQLNTMELYNLKRAIAETAMLAMLSASLLLLGDAKDHKGNWARRHLIYQLKRMQMETMASNPLSGYGFISNMIKMLNSPVAAINVVEKISNLVKFTDLTQTIESGKHQGENKYVYNLERSLPFYGQIVKAYELGESDDLFKLFN